MFRVLIRKLFLSRSSRATRAEFLKLSIHSKENIQIPSFLWRLSDDVRRMILHKQGRKFSSFGIDSNHIFALKKAAGRTTLKRLELILHRLSEVDRLSKGLFVEKSDGNAWQELKAACLLLAAKNRDT